MKEDGSEFIYWLTLELKKRGWTKYRLSKEAGIPYTTIENMFHRNSTPSFQTVLKIFAAFGMKTGMEFLDRGQSEEEVCSILDTKDLDRELILQRLDEILYEVKMLKGYLTSDAKNRGKL